jgi:hypothetical protein
MSQYSDPNAAACSLISEANTDTDNAADTGRSER